MQRRANTFKSLGAFDDLGGAALAVHVDLQNDGAGAALLLVLLLPLFSPLALLLAVVLLLQRQGETKQQRNQRQCWSLRPWRCVGDTDAARKEGRRVVRRPTSAMVSRRLADTNELVQCSMEKLGEVRGLRGFLFVGGEG